MPKANVLALRKAQRRSARRSRAIDILNNAICFLLGAAATGVLFEAALSHHGATHSGTQPTPKPLQR